MIDAQTEQAVAHVAAALGQGAAVGGRVEAELPFPRTAAAEMRVAGGSSRCALSARAAGPIATHVAIASATPAEPARRHGVPGQPDAGSVNAAGAASTKSVPAT